MPEDPEVYHLRELTVARTPGDSRRIMPSLPAGTRTVLDVGCGAGQTLLALDLSAGILLCGVDVDESALRLGSRLESRLLLARARGEMLPFADDCFDAVLCRVALPYMDVSLALHEMERVLRRGGHLWVVLHPIRVALAALWGHLRAGQPKGALFQMYVLANGLALHFLGRQFRFPFGRYRMESVQTERGMMRALAAAGFQSVNAKLNRFFVVTASKATGES